MHAAFLHGFVERRAYYPKGGGQVLAGNITDVIRTHGSEVRTRS
jgi:ferredoxin--NADP+ reductase